MLASTPTLVEVMELLQEFPSEEWESLANCFRLSQNDIDSIEKLPPEMRIESIMTIWFNTSDNRTWTEFNNALVEQGSSKLQQN